MAWGDRFHLLMQQQQMGLPVEQLLLGDPAFEAAVRSLQTTAPQLFRSDSAVSEFADGPLASSPTESPSAQRVSEHLRSFTFGGHSFSVVYDLLITEPQRAQIIDWKTYPRPQNARWLAEHWQTRLYCYSLVQTSDYVPEQVSMTYWFVRGDAKGDAKESALENLGENRDDSRESRSKAEVGEFGRSQQSQGYQPQSLHFPYSKTQHRAVHHSLAQALERLDRWLLDYGGGTPLPQVEMARGQCDRCPFAQRCGRAGANHKGAVASDWMTTDLASIDEVVP